MCRRPGSAVSASARASVAQRRRRPAAADPVQQEVAGVQVPADRVLRLGLGVVGEGERDDEAAVAAQRARRPHVQQLVEPDVAGQGRQPRAAQRRARRRRHRWRRRPGAAGPRPPRHRPRPPRRRCGARPRRQHERLRSRPPRLAGPAVTPETSAVWTGISSEGPRRTWARPGWLRGILAAAGESITSVESWGVCTRRQTRRLVLARMFSLTAPDGRCVASSMWTPRLRPRWAMPTSEGTKSGSSAASVANSSMTTSSRGSGAAWSAPRRRAGRTR